MPSIFQTDIILWRAINYNMYIGGTMMLGCCYVKVHHLKKLPSVREFVRNLLV